VKVNVAELSFLSFRVKTKGRSRGISG